MHYLVAPLKSLLFAALLASSYATASTTYVADFNGPSLDPGLALQTIKNRSSSAPTTVPGVSLPWIAGIDNGYLSLAKTFTLPGHGSDDIPMAYTTFATTGDFVATVTTDSSYDGAGYGGFFFYNNNGFTGLRVDTNAVSNEGVPIFNPAYVSTPTGAVVTLRIARHNDTLTSSYKPDGASDFIVLSSVTSSLVLGDAYFDMSVYSDQMYATALLFQHLTITQVPEPETFAMLLGGLAVIGRLARRRPVARPR